MASILKIDMRLEQVRRILDAAVGNRMPYHDGLGKFWNLDRDTLVTATVYDERLVVPGRPEDSALVNSLRGLPPFDGTSFVRMPPGGQVREEDIAFIEEWIRAGAPDNSLKQRAPISEKIRSIEPILDLDDLRRHLQLAIEIEHATIPPYLTAFYSLRRNGANGTTASLIRKVFIEEMLHFTLACNILNAVAGVPRIALDGFIPDYPVRLPQSDTDFDVHLQRCSDAALDNFLQIEFPSFPLPARLTDVGYRTIGEFYKNVREGLIGLCDRLGPNAVFTGQQNRQVTTGVPGVFAVIDRPSALQALDLIVVQGEGTEAPDTNNPSADKPHFFLFRDIRERKIRGSSGPLPPEQQFDPTDVRPTVKNPRQAGEAVRELSRTFDMAYSDLLRALDRVFNGNPNEIRAALGRMRSLGPMVTSLMDQSIGDGMTAGPTYFYYT